MHFSAPPNIRVDAFWVPFGKDVVRFIHPVETKSGASLRTFGKDEAEESRQTGIGQLIDLYGSLSTKFRLKKTVFTETCVCA